MANAGGGAAYQRLTTPDNRLSQTLQNVSNQNLRREQEDRARQERDLVRGQQREAALNKEMSEAISSVEPVITGIQSVDEINYRATAMAQQRIGDIYRDFRDNPKNQSDVNKRMELANLKSFPKTLKGMEGKVTAAYKDLTEGYASGKYSKWDEDKLDKIEAFYGVKGKDGKFSPNYIIDFDKKGNMISKAIDKNGNYFEVSIYDIMNGTDMLTPTEAVNAQQYTSDIVKGLGKRQEVRIRNGFMETVQEFSSQEDEVRKDLREALGTAEEPSDLAKSIWSDEDNMNKNKGDFKEGSLKEIEDYLVRKVEMKYDTTISSRQLRKEGGTGDGNKSKISISLMKNTSGDPLVETIEGPNKKGESYEKYTGFSLSKPITTGVGNADKKITRLYLSNKGDIIFKGTQRVKSGSSGIFSTDFNQSPEKAYEEVTGGGLNSEELNVVANMLGYGDASELKNKLEELGGEGSTNSDRGILD